MEVGLHPATIALHVDITAMASSWHGSEMRRDK